MDLPRRGPGARELDVLIPPSRMPLIRDRRLLKRWRYVGLFGPELMLCAGDARIGPLPVRWWAVAEPGEPLAEHTSLIASGGVELTSRRLEVRARDVWISLALEPDGEPIEVVSPHGGSYIWTGKRPCRARGTVTIRGRSRGVELAGLADDSAGYHARETAWRWSAGAGMAESGERVAWNLVEGVHDAAAGSERTVWVDGRAAEAPEAPFATDLSSVGGMAFSEWSARVDRTNLGFFRNLYRQPFGTFAGELPGGLRLREGYGVMEEHEARW